jgi:tetratricopeptide (TPR) repeat protein
MGRQKKLSRNKHHVIYRWHRAAALLSLLLLAACAGKTPPSPPPGATQSPATQSPDEDRTVQDRVREPAQQQRGGVQVFPLQNPAVKELLKQAEQSENVGDYDSAAVSIERALRIQPRDPELLQRMAEIQLQKKDYQQALNFASRSYDSGPRVGELCNRNWRTMMVAQQALGDNRSANMAEARANECNNQRPQSY